MRSISSFFDRCTDWTLFGSAVLEDIVLFLACVGLFFWACGDGTPYSVLALFLRAFLAYYRYLFPKLLRLLLSREISVFWDFSRSVVAMVLLILGVWVSFLSFSKEV